MTDALCTQVIVEHWFASNPGAQVTQVITEHWHSVDSITSARASMVFIEHWSSVDKLGDIPRRLKLTTEPVYVMRGDQIEVWPVNLQASGGERDPKTMRYTVTTEPIHGQLQIGGVKVTNFTQTQVNANSLFYVHDGGADFTDSFSVAVVDPTTTLTEPATVAVHMLDTVYDTLDGWADPLTVPFNNTVPLTDWELYAFGGLNDDNLTTFTIIRQPTHGTLTLNGSPVTTITDQQLIDQVVQYTHDGVSMTPDSFEVRVSDPTGVGLEPTPNNIYGECAVVWKAPFTTKIILGNLTPGEDNYTQAYPAACTPDGRYVVGACKDADGIYRAVRWDTTTSICTELARVLEEDVSAIAISDDGQIIYGGANGDGEPGFSSSGYRNKVIRWTSGGTVGELLPHNPDDGDDSYVIWPTNTEPQQVASYDGTILVGRYGYQLEPATKWVNGSPVSLLGANGRADAHAMSADGSIAVGRHINAGNVYEGVYWIGTERRALTSPPEAMDLSDNPSGNGPYAWLCNVDASVIWGTSPNWPQAAYADAGYWDNTTAFGSTEFGVDQDHYGTFHFLERQSPDNTNQIYLQGVADGPGNLISVGDSPAGRQHYRATKWDGTTAINLGAIECAWYSSAWACTFDGSIVVGTSDDFDYRSWPVWWDAAGTLHKLPTHNFLQYSYQGSAYGISRDGSTIFGQLDVGEVDWVVEIEITVPITEVQTAVLHADSGVSTVITADDLRASGGEGKPETMMLSVVVPPAHGSIQMGGVVVTSFSQAQIDAGLVTYVNNGDGIFTDAFEITARDPTGAAPPPVVSQVAVMWNYPFTTCERLDRLPLGQGAQALGCSYDGQTITGMANDAPGYEYPVKWDKTTHAITELELLSNNYQIHQCSMDGQVLLGGDNGQLTITRYDGTFAQQLVAPGPTYTAVYYPGGQRKMTDSGNIIIGGYVSNISPGVRAPGYWTGLTFTALPTHPIMTTTTLSDGCSADASIIVGGVAGYSHPTPAGACFWVGGEIRLLATMYHMHPPSFVIFDTSRAYTANADGTVIYGWAPDFNQGSPGDLSHALWSSCYWDNLSTTTVIDGDTFYGVLHFVPNIEPDQIYRPYVRYYAETTAPIYVGQNYPDGKPVRWNGVVPTALPAPGRAMPIACSADGERVTGTFTDTSGPSNVERAAYWDENDVLHELPSLSNVYTDYGITSQPNGMSRDGTLIFGYQYIIDYPDLSTHYSVPIVIKPPPLSLITGTLTATFGAATVVTTNEIHASGGENNPATLLLTVRQPPSHGTLTALTFTQAQIDAGFVTYTHAGGDNTTTDRFWVTVSDPTGKLPDIELLRAGFTAPNFTDPANYTSDVGGGWAAVSGKTAGQLWNGGFEGTGGEAMYRSSMIPPTPDYAVQLSVSPPVTNLDLPTQSLWVIGRATTHNTGYRATVTVIGQNYTLALSVGGGPTVVSVPLGALTYNSMFIVRMEMLGSDIFATVQRTQDNWWVTSAGGWQPDQVIAAHFTDSTYTEAGQMMIGGLWP